MNKVISSQDRVFMSLVGPSGSGKTRLIFDMLQSGTFQPPYGKIIYFYRHFQTIYSSIQDAIPNIEFVKCIDYELINNLPDDGTHYLLIFDDSCAEISKSREFEQIATSGRHRKLSVIFIKHNLFHKSPLGRDIDLQSTHIVLFKSPRDVNQIQKFGQQLGIGKHFVNWYRDATDKSYGHLMIDLSPNVPDILRFCTDCGTFPSKFYVPSSKARITILDENFKRSLSIYSKVLPEFYSRESERISPDMSS